MSKQTHYDNAYADTNVYGHVVKLLSRIKAEPGSIHLDFGCGYGRMAEPIRDELGLRYIGLDIDEEGLVSLKERGFEVMFIDLRDPESAIEQIRRYLPAEIPVASISIVDTIEHLSEPAKSIGLLQALVREFSCPLVASVPNFSHKDIGFKLAFGRFDYTQSGLLDHTHRMYFTEKGFSDLMSSCGLHQIEEYDVVLSQSDQAFPRDHAALSLRTPLHELMAGLREQAEPNGQVNQFVRMYLGGHLMKGEGPIDSVAASRGQDEVFLSVVTRTQGRRIDSLRETLLCLSAQTCQDFEVLIIGHDLDIDAQLAVERVISDLHESVRERVRLMRVEGGTRATPLNGGFAAASGRYVAMLDDDDLVMGNWVETFAGLAKKNGGCMLRSVAVAQSWDKVEPVQSPDHYASRAVGPMQSLYPEDFDLFKHLIENRSPLHSLAFPRSVYSDMGFRFDPRLTTAEDWDFIVRVAPVTGVATSKNVTCIYRRWINSENSFSLHDQDEWRANYYYTLRKIDGAPIILPAGATRELRNMMYELDRLRCGPSTLTMPHSDPDRASVELEQERYLEALRWRYHELSTSLSWRLTSPLRYFKALLKGDKQNNTQPKLWRLSAKDLEYLINQIESSKSWKITSILRSVRRKMRI